MCQLLYTNLMNRLILLTIFFVVIIYSCNTSTTKNQPDSPLSNSLSIEPEGTLSIGGAYSLNQLMQLWADSFMALHPKVKISITKEGTGEGINGLISEKFDIAMVSTFVDDPDTSVQLEYIPVTQDAVVLIMNQQNPYLNEIKEKGITPQQLLNLFTSEKKISWGEILNTTYRAEAIVYTRYDVSGAAEIWAGFLWKTQSDLKGLPVQGEDEMIRKVQSTPFSIGYCNLANAFDMVTMRPLEKIAIVPIDLDYDRVVDFKDIKQTGLNEIHRSIWLGKYPKTLCRKLNLAVKVNNLNPLMNAFLVYILNDGQKYVSDKGFCPLNNIQIKHSYDKLEVANKTMVEQIKE